MDSKEYHPAYKSTIEFCDDNYAQIHNDESIKFVQGRPTCWDIVELIVILFTFFLESI